MSGTLWYRRPAQLWVEALPPNSIDSEGRLMEWPKGKLTHLKIKASADA